MIKSEWRLLELVSLGLETEGTAIEFDEILQNPRLDWGEVLDQALRHKVIQLLAHTVAAQRAWASLPRFLSEHLRETLRVNRHRIRLYREAAVEIATVLRQRDLRFACTKGIALESSVYLGEGERYMVDIDFMIEPHAREVVTSVLKELGYELGYHDWRRGYLHRFTRPELIAYRLNPDHLPPFVRSTDDALVSHLHVDFACSLTWTQCEYQPSVAEALADVCYQPVPGLTGREIPILNTHYQFIFTILHLFREAWKEQWLDLEQDVNLIKFADVVRIWRRGEATLRTTEFRARLEYEKIVEPVAWVLVHLDRTFGTSLARTLELDQRVSPQFLNSAAGLAGATRRQWRGTMRDRLQTRRRRELFDET